MPKRRFVCIDPSTNTNKFWNIGCNTTTVYTEWGRIGTAGQRKEKPCVSVGAALILMGRLIREKVLKGYVELAESEQLVPIYSRPLMRVPSDDTVRDLLPPPRPPPYRQRKRPPAKPKPPPAIEFNKRDITL